MRELIIDCFAGATVLDLFSAAAGGWSLGLHRAGFRTVAACEAVAWRRALYAENNPGVPIYDDVRTVSAERLLRDLGFLPAVVVGSPPCQDISSANPKGKGVEGERSGLYFEAIRIVGEVRPRWLALENSANLRSRGADAVLGALEALGYACWPLVVRARDIGANHERPRSWIIGCDLDQLADPDGFGRHEGRSGRRVGLDLPASAYPDDDTNAARQRRDARAGHAGAPRGREPADLSGDAAQDGCGSRRPGRHSLAAAGLSLGACRHAARAPADPDQAGQADGCLVSGVRQAEISDDGCGDVRRHDVANADREEQPDSAEHGEVGGSARLGGSAAEPWSDWNGGLAGHLRVDDGVSAGVARARIAVGGPKGTSAASLIVEAFGDAVVPQIPEAIGRAILRVEAAYAALSGREGA